MIMNLDQLRSYRNIISGLEEHISDPEELDLCIKLVSGQIGPQRCQMYEMNRPYVRKRYG